MNLSKPECWMAVLCVLEDAWGVDMPLLMKRDTARVAAHLYRLNEVKGHRSEAASIQRARQFVAERLAPFH